MMIEKKLWGTSEGRNVSLYTISNAEMKVSVTDYGCTVTDILIGEKHIILGYSKFKNLEADKYYVGSLTGRFAGRISKASFEIDGVEYKLASNDGNTGNHLHGGFHGFNKMLFTEVSTHSGETFAALTFRGISKHLEEGYPGTVDLTISITLNVDNELIFSYYARTDQPTHINLTHHLYYNLNGREKEEDQYLKIIAEQIVDTSDQYIPSGQLVKVSDEFDFSSSKKIPRQANFNECYVVNTTNKLAKVAELVSNDLSLIMQLSSTCPGLVFYSGQFLDKPFSPRQAICLETQYYPDSPNQPSFPSTLFDSNKNYKEYTKLSFLKAI